MNQKLVDEICIIEFGEVPFNCQRMKTGLANYVYLVQYEKKYILRISDPTNDIQNNTYWLEKLSNLKISIPNVIAKGEIKKNKYMIMSYIEGTDLNYVYSDMSEDDKKILADRIIDIQELVSSLPQNKGYGSLSCYGDKSAKESWKEVLLGDLHRSIEWMQQGGIFEIQKIHIVIGLLDKFEDYFTSVEPIPFLDDITTKNVLIKNNELSGVIDFDWITFGDILYFVALTNMSLLNSEHDTVYIKYLIERLNLNEEEIQIVQLYTLIFCVIFMSEKGMKFNKEDATPVDIVEIKRLKSIYKELINIFLEK